MFKKPRFRERVVAVVVAILTISAYADTGSVTQSRTDDEVSLRIPQIDLDSKVAEIFTVTNCKWLSGMTCRVSYNGKQPLPSEVFFQEFDSNGKIVGPPRRLIYPELKAGHAGLGTF